MGHRHGARTRTAGSTAAISSTIAWAISSPRRPVRIADDRRDAPLQGVHSRRQDAARGTRAPPDRTDPPARGRPRSSSSREPRGISSRMLHCTGATCSTSPSASTVASRSTYCRSEVHGVKATKVGDQRQAGGAHLGGRLLEIRPRVPLLQLRQQAIVHRLDRRRDEGAAGLAQHRRDVPDVGAGARS